MTMPHERTRAVIGTRELLEQLRMRDDIPSDIRKDAIWCLRHFPTETNLKVAGYAVTRSGIENPFGTSPDYDEHKANLAKIEATERDKASKREALFNLAQFDQDEDIQAADRRLSVFIAEPLTERMITAPRDGDTPDEVVDRQE